MVERVPIPRTPQTEEERFWAKVDKSGDCWLWQGARNPHGYGQFSRNGRHVVAHRVSWGWRHGAVPDGYLLCHRCDVPGCVNPDHLFVGTQSDNMRDCAAKGRIARVGKSKNTHCRHGHPWDEVNTRWVGRWRKCRTCDHNRQRRKRLALRALAASGPSQQCAGPGCERLVLLGPWQRMYCSEACQSRSWREKKRGRPALYTWRRAAP